MNSRAVLIVEGFWTYELWVNIFWLYGIPNISWGTQFSSLGARDSLFSGHASFMPFYVTAFEIASYKLHTPETLLLLDNWVKQECVCACMHACMHACVLCCVVLCCVVLCCVCAACMCVMDMPIDKKGSRRREHVST